MLNFLRPITDSGGFYSLSSNAARDIPIPKHATLARINTSTALTYAFITGLPSEDTTDGDFGFPLSANAASSSTDIAVPGGQILRLIETGGAGNCYIEFFGNKKSPGGIRAGRFRALALASGVLSIDTELLPTATYVKLSANRAFRFSTDGNDPTGTEGIGITGRTTVEVPISKHSEVRCTAVSAGVTHYSVQWIEDRSEPIGADIFDARVSQPLGAFHTAFPNANVVNVDVPKNAKWAWLADHAWTDH